MTMLKVHALVAEMLEQGQDNQQIRKTLFNTKGVRLQQIRNVMALLD